MEFPLLAGVDPVGEESRSKPSTTDASPESLLRVVAKKILRRRNEEQNWRGKFAPKKPPEELRFYLYSSRKMSAFDCLLP
jgi:hypothetical protein